MFKRNRFHFLSRMMLLSFLVLAACQPIQPQPASSTTTEVMTDQALGRQLDALLTRLNQEGDFNGAVLIARDGQVVLRKGYGLADRDQQLANTPTTRFRLASITKQFTALAILMLQEQGKLSVADRVCQYIQGCPASWATMTIHHLLTHTSGLYDFRDFTYTGETPPAPSTSAQVIERIKAQPLAFEPGVGFRYTNGGFMVAGYIVEQVAGQSYEQFLQEQIFDPVGMENTGYAHDGRSLAVGYRDATTPENPIDGSLPFAAAGLYSTVDDLYRYTQTLESERLVSQQSLDAFAGQHILMGADNGGFSPGYEAPTYYAYGWGVATFHGHRVIGHDGWIEGYGGDVRRYPNDQVTTILLMNQSEPWAALIGDQIAQTIFGIESAEADPADDQLDLEREMIAREIATFDHLRQHDVAAVEAEISTDFSWIDATGVKQRADYLAVVADENLTFDEPVRGEMEIRILSPEVVLVIYAIDTHGSYAGVEFSNHEYISSLWVKRAGQWQNVFLHATPRGVAQQ